MKRFKMKAYLVLTLLLGVFLLSGCGGGSDSIGESGGDAGTNDAGATLTAIAVTPVDPSIPSGVTKQFTATGNYSDGTSDDITASVIWSSGEVQVATMNDGGLATGLAAGSSIMTATVGVQSASTTLTVTAATLSSIAVTPVNPHIVVGLTKLFTATGNYSDGTSNNITASVLWTSGEAQVATMNAGGLATGLAVGSSVMTATVGAQSASTTLTVTDATLRSIAVTPVNPKIAVGLTKAFTATGNYSDGSSDDITASVLWSSGETQVATMNDGGLATGIAAGSSVMTATVGTQSASTTLTVTSATLSSIAVTPTNPSIVGGLTKQLAATGTYSDGSVADISASVIWSSGEPLVATVNAGGQTSGIAPGLSLITATVGSKSASTTLTVTAETLSSIAVTPFDPTIVNGQTQKLKAIGTYSDSSTADITAEVVWSSDDILVATLNPNGQATSGLATGIDVGNALITATLGSTSADSLLTVTAALLDNPLAPNLGEVERFVILAAQAITTTSGSAIVNGDLGILDQARTYYAGFTPGASAGEFKELTNGLSYAADDSTPPYVIPTPYASMVAFINQSRTDLGIAYNFLAADPNPNVATQVCPTELGNQTFTRGVYKTASDVTIQTGALILDAGGYPDSVFIFTIGGNLTIGAPFGEIILSNGAQAKNVYWRTAGTTIIGTDRSFAGNVFAWTQVNVLTKASVTGRLFAVTEQVTLDFNAVTKAL